MSADELDREVNRLYWKTTEPVTRLATRLEISRGTFYNHLRPLPADATCSACGGRLLFRTRSSRDSGDAHCGDCGADQRLASGTGSAPAAANRSAGARSAAGARAATGARPAPAGRAAPAARKPRAAEESEEEGAGPRLTGSASRIAARVAERLGDDERRTQLLVLAVTTAALGLGILYYSRHRS